MNSLFSMPVWEILTSIVLGLIASIWTTVATFWGTSPILLLVVMGLLSLKLTRS